MIRLSSLDQDAAVELLMFLAEEESFGEVKKQLAGRISVDHVRSTLKELAMSLAHVETDDIVSDTNHIDSKLLSKKTKDVLSTLSSEQTDQLKSLFSEL